MPKKLTVESPTDSPKSALLPVGKKGAFFTVDKPLVADASGRLSVEFTGAGCVVEIAPLL